MAGGYASFQAPAHRWGLYHSFPKAGLASQPLLAFDCHYGDHDGIRVEVPANSTVFLNLTGFYGKSCLALGWQLPSGPRSYWNLI